MAINAVIRFLQAARDLIKNNKNVGKDEIIRFAELEFGEVSQFLRKQIDNLFKKGTPSESKIGEFFGFKNYPKTAQKKKGEVVPIKKKEGIVAVDDVAKIAEEDRAIEQMYRTAGPRNLDEDKMYLAEFLAEDAGKVLDDLPIAEQNKFIERARKALIRKVGKYKQEGIMATDEATEIVKKRTDDIATGDVTGEVDKGLESLGTNMKKLREAVEELKKVSQDTTPGGIMKEIMKGQKVMAENYKTGNIRTAVRQFMQSEVKAGRLKPINDFDKEALKVYGQTTESDPINIFRRYYGEDALEAVDEIGDVFRQGESFKHYEELLRNSVDKKFLTPKTKGLGEYDAGVLTPQQENELRKQLLKEQDQKQMLEDWDPDREPSAHGGIIGNLHLNRTGFKIGSVPKSFKLAKKIRDSKEYKDFIEKLFLKASTMIRRGEGLFKDLTQSQKITQHDNLTKEAVNYQKTGELPEAVHQYFGINPEHVYVQKLIKMEEANVAALEKSREKVRNFKKLQEFDPSGRKPNADGGLIDILKL